MARSLLLLLFAAPAALAGNMWVDGIPGCTREAAMAGGPLPFGCANALNLAAMTDAPAERARAESAASRAGPAIRAEGQLRAGKPPALPGSSSRQGK